MAALTADRITKMRAGGYSRTIIGKLAATTKIYKGSLVAKNAAGHVVPASDTAGLVVLGVAQSTVDNTAGVAGALEVAIVTGAFKLNNFATNPAVQANMHTMVLVADDNAIRVAGTVNSIRAGLLELIESDGVWVYVDPIVSLA